MVHDSQRPALSLEALEQRIVTDSDQAELVIFEIAQPAMDQLGAGRGGRAGKIGLLDQQHAEAATGRVAGDADAVDAAGRSPEDRTCGPREWSELATLDGPCPGNPAVRCHRIDHCRTA